MFDKIPNELKAQKQWVCAWSRSKCPMQALRQEAASASNPETWSRFEDALEAVETMQYDNLGYVFADNGYVGIDIDAGYEDGMLTDLAAEVIGLCKSYTEKSRSGRGVHIILKGNLPFNGQNNHLDHIEIYKTGRFFITTGKMVYFSEIIENQSAINAIVDKYFPEMTKNAENSKNSHLPTYGFHYKLPEDGKISLEPIYEHIGVGGRNNLLTSLAGQLHSAGLPFKSILAELRKVNERFCEMPLQDREIQQIAKSVSKYERQR